MGHGVMVAQGILVPLVEVRILVSQQNYNKMNYTTGYKGMLRDRCPTVVNYALKWQKAKERWIDHTYRNFVKIFCDKNERYHVTRIILGIAKNERSFEFKKSIDWDNLTNEEKEYWERVLSWIDWFGANYSKIKTEYQSSLESGIDEFTIKVNIINNHLSSLLPNKNASEEEKQAKYDYVDKLVDYLIKCFNSFNSKDYA